MVHMGLALVFFAYCLSNVPALSETQGTTSSEDVSVDHEAYSVVIVDREWTRDTGVSQRGEDWDTFNGTLRMYRDGSLLSTGDIQVISSWKMREYGTLTYKEEGLTKRMNGEIVASDLQDDSLLIRFQSFRTGMATVVDLFSSDNSLAVWPALYADADILENEVVRIRNDTQIWDGFLVSVEGEKGNVTLRKLDGTQVVIPGDEVDRFYRKAYTGLAMTDVHIHGSLVKDMYVSIVSATPSSSGGFEATIMVSEVPAMLLLWVGMALMSLGVVLRPLEHYGERHKDEVGDGEPADDEDETDEEESEEQKEEEE